MSDITTQFNRITEGTLPEAYLSFIQTEYETTDIDWIFSAEGYLYDQIMDIEYSAVPAIFFSYESIIDRFDYDYISQHDHDFHLDYIKNCIPFCEDESGNLFLIDMNIGGKIIFWHMEYNFPETVGEAEGVWIVAGSLAQFFSKQVQDDIFFNKVKSLLL